MEEWRTIEEFPNYAVSDMGRVKRINKGRRTQVGKIISQRKNRGGYMYVTLCKDGKRKSKTIHRLVLNAFIGKSDLDCNHIDGDKTNNKLENLEYCTKSRNMIHAYENGLEISVKGEKHGRSKLKEDEVWLIKRILNSDLFRDKKITQDFISKMFKVNFGTISKIKKGTIWSHLE